MISHILDTNICIELIRGKSDKILNRLTKYEVGQIGISSITLAELEFGVYKSKRPADNKLILIEFCSPLEILAFDENAASVYGKIRAQLEKKGKQIGPLDTLIAAHALSINAVLVTNNVREFKRVRGLKIDNWT